MSYSKEQVREEWEDLYEKVSPLVEKMKSKYPPELNMEGLEPALTQDIVEIAQFLLSTQREEFLAAMMARKFEVCTDERGTIYAVFVEEIKSILNKK